MHAHNPRQTVHAAVRHGVVLHVLGWMCRSGCINAVRADCVNIFQATEVPNLDAGTVTMLVHAMNAFCSKGMMKLAHIQRMEHIACLQENFKAIQHILHVLMLLASFGW